MLEENKNINEPEPTKKKEERNILECAEEWAEIENLVMTYKKLFVSENLSDEEKEESKNAASALLTKFMPLFQKYKILIKTCKIDFNDAEQKRFVLSFIGDYELKNALKRDKQSYEIKRKIAEKFNFVRQTYGAQDEDIILEDLQMLMLVLAKRYKQMGRNFCAYVYYAYWCEVSRYIKKYINNPGNIEYKNCEYKEYMQNVEDPTAEEILTERSYENELGLPDFSWISGEACGEAFESLTPIERKIVVKYYLENYNDRQIAEEFGIHINTCNQKRRAAVSKIAKAMDLPESMIVRNRNSGKNAMVNC